MKITASQLRMIIKEEVKRAKRVNLHENPLAMVDSDLGNALTNAVKDAISTTVALQIGRGLEPERVEEIQMQVEESLWEISTVIEDFVDVIAQHLSTETILPSDAEL